ncbi:MAG: hypothetical protein F4Z28_06780 [Gammaproteobacteria bacterium]|nr:hypothetical protein [Gammaproteobacteria bacterium]
MRPQWSNSRAKCRISLRPNGRVDTTPMDNTVGATLALARETPSVALSTRAGSFPATTGSLRVTRVGSRVFAAFVATALAVLLNGCDQPAAKNDRESAHVAGIAVEAIEGATPWTSLQANDAEEDFHFVIVSDRTGDARPGVFASAIPKVNVLEPAFVVSVGDLIEGYTQDQAQIEREWDEFEGFVDQLEVPFFYAAGNHDMSNAVMADAWQARFGPSFYRFVYKDVLFLVLNSELFGMVSKPDTPVPGPWTQAEQLAFVERTLAEVPAPRWTIVIVHQPLWDYARGVRGDWPQVETLLAGRDYTVFAGHFHHYVKIERQDSNYITLATTGGGSGLRGSLYGEFDHVALATMAAGGPRIANLMLEGIHDADLVTEDVRDTMYWLDDAVQSVPILQSPNDGAFSEGTVAFQVTNGGDADLTVALHVDPGPDLRYAGTAQTVAIPANGEHVFSFPLSTDKPVPYPDIVPGRVFWSLSTHTGQRPVDLNVVSALLPVTTFAIPGGDAPSVDGDLSEWANLPYQARQQGDVVSPRTAETDIAYSFAVQESDGDLYIAVRVRDDSLLADEGRGLLTQDSVMIAVDSRPDPERSANLRLQESSRDLAQMAVGLVTLPGIVEESYYLRYLDASRAAVASKATATATGYDVELKVDGDYLDQRAGAPWQTLRLAITAVDWDAGEDVNEIPWYAKGSDGVALHWVPYRFGEAPVAASGTFVRSVEE